jgi:Catalytic LigB subunit of aromatic ring-opening dioxygenase
MARIIGGIGASHVPTIGVAYDKGQQQDPVWKPLFDGFAPVAHWLKEVQPDIAVVIYNDHANSFFFDLYPTFALGIAASYVGADEGAGVRNLPSVKGDVEFSAHLAEQLINAEFDLAMFQDRALDHGVLSPLPLLWPHSPDWPIAVVPLAVNVLQHPLPTAARCHRLGRALRQSIASYPKDLKVVVIGTGGLSHQLQGERTGFNDTEWDHQFLDLLVTDPESLASLTHAEYIRRGGAEGLEVIMWLVMRGALGGEIVERHRSYYLATTTALAVAYYEPSELTRAQDASN